MRLIYQNVNVKILHGNNLATENQQARINDVIEVKTSVYLHRT